MGCGQSKINLYPRRKNGGKGNSSKKSGAADEADEEEGSAGSGGPAADDPEEEHDRVHKILPLAVHPQTMEISASQQDFFKLLDEKIEQGKDYDSASETEEQERYSRRIQHWNSVLESIRSSVRQSSPSTPVRKKIQGPGNHQERHSSPSFSRRCYKPHGPDGMSPPPRRPQGPNQTDPRQINGEYWMKDDPNMSPKNGNRNACKSMSFNQKLKKNEFNENQNINKEFDTKNSQITYNPTFQSQSPAHSVKPQPYVAQIVNYPTSQQINPPSPPKFIAPPEEYQDPQNNETDSKFSTYQTTTQTQNSQSIYYIHGNANVSQDIFQQRQQTAFHLQQYVAMKQAQQQMYTYLQRGPHTVYPTVDPNRIYDTEEHSQYGNTRPHSAPSPAGMVRHIAPGYIDHMHQAPVWSPMPAVVSSTGPWVQNQIPPEMQYYPQMNYMPMYRPHSAGSAGTLTRYKDKDDQRNQCQSINLVRQKPVGQIVTGGKELTVCTSASDSPSPASASTDSGVSPGNSTQSSKNSVFSTISMCSVKDTPQTNVVDAKNKKNKTSSFKALKNSKSLDSS